MCFGRLGGHCDLLRRGFERLKRLLRKDPVPVAKDLPGDMKIASDFNFTDNRGRHRRSFLKVLENPGFPRFEIFELKMFKNAELPETL